jgi:glycosyltransferase involved in cell wall biosynthesis
MRPKRVLVLLTLNERYGVEQIVPRLPKEKFDEIMAIDGGSTDGTQSVLETYGIPVIRQKSIGRGSAFRQAVASSTGDFYVFFSPDGNEDVQGIPKLFDCLEAGAEMAIGSRFLPGGSNEEDRVSWPLRKWVNQAFTAMANCLWNRGAFITDTINGFRGITRKAFERLHLSSDGFTIEYEMSIHAMKAKLKVVEIPTREESRLGGQTKAPSMKTGISFVKFFIYELFGCPFHPTLS